jgi:hypothetical protein
MTAPPNTQRENLAQGPPGIVDTIGLAFGILNRRPHLVWLPVALDALLWTGFRFSPVGLAELASRSFPSEVTASDTLGEWLIDRIASSDLFYLVTLLVPTFLTSLGRGDIASVRDHHVLTADVAIELAALVLLLMVGVVLGTAYLTTVGRLIQGEPAWGRRFFALCVGNSWRLFGLCVVMFAALGLIGFPVAALAAGMIFAGVNPTTIVTMFVVMLGVWGGLFFFFGQYAIAVWSASPLEALRSSYIFVVRNLAHVLGFILMFIIIRTGTSVALRALTDSPWSVPLALVINAYVATILIAAAMMFYRDRAVEASASAGQHGSPAVSAS